MFSALEEDSLVVVFHVILYLLLMKKVLRHGPKKKLEFVIPIGRGRTTFTNHPSNAHLLKYGQYLLLFPNAVLVRALFKERMEFLFFSNVGPEHRRTNKLLEKLMGKCGA